jgi:sugar transferase (PEP-CTERM/EpsH1 system associated)
VRLGILLRRLRPDVVHSRNWSAFDAVPAARLARVRAIVHGEHGREASDPQGRNPRRNRLRRLAAPLIDRFVAVSDDLRRWLVTVVGVPEPRVVTIHNGVDTVRFTDDGRDDARRALALPLDAPVVGTVGRLDPVKDQMSLLDAVARLGDCRPAPVLVVVGDGPCRRSLEERARTADLAGRVRFLGERADVPRLLRGFDVFVLPSIAEGISNTILEAMASGLPVIATQTGGNPELVAHGVTGALVPVGDPVAIAHIIRDYLADPHLRGLHGKAGRKRVVEEFRLERMAEQYGELYRTLAQARGIR